MSQKSTADMVGIGISLGLAAVLLVVLLMSSGDEDPTIGAQQVSTFSAPVPTQVPTTAPVAMPAVQPAQTSALDASLASISVAADEPQRTLRNPEVPDINPESTAPTNGDVDAGNDDASEVDDASDSDAGADDAVATNDSVEAFEAGSDDTATAPNPQAQATAVPNPQPAATAVPNPQPAATAVPNPQPAATAVPNPQPGSQSAQTNVQVPAAAPVGGTFTHTLTATVSRPTLYSSPGGAAFTPTFNGTALPAVNPTVFGNPLVYRVLAGTPDDGTGWAQVFVPARPNGTKAWVRTSEFRWGSSNRMLQINVAASTVTVFEGSNVILTTSGVMGKSASRTPIASGWVEEIMAGPSAAYGTKLISLGIFSDDLSSFGGSIPKIALHGTNNPGLMGQHASNGCIRIRNEIINQVAAMLPVGSKVEIVN